MNLPNGMTLFRVVLTPVFMILMLAQFPHHYIAALTVFVIASITDALDGQLARRHGRITDFGKFMDPLADKMLTTAAWLCLKMYTRFQKVFHIIPICLWMRKAFF